MNAKQILMRALVSLLMCITFGVVWIRPCRGGATTRIGATPRARAAILNEPALPIKGAGSSPQTIAQILDGAGIGTRLVSAKELADASILNVSAFDLLVLPTGQSFPSTARESVVKFLHEGGDLVATGGYAFNHLMLQQEDGWRSEAEWRADCFAKAISKEKSLLMNGGFETVQNLAGPGQTVTGQWTRSNASRCHIVEESPQEGRFCAKVVVSPQSPDLGPIFTQDVPAQQGAVYRVSGWLKTLQVIESGMAFIACYQYNDQDELVTFRDFAVARGTSDWTHHHYVFTPAPGVNRLHIKFGLFETHGTAWFDDIRVGDVTGIQLKPMNTSSGKPVDGLQVREEQIGVFDASFPLKRARRLKTADGQHVVKTPVELERGFSGWVASGIVGSDDARWIPLLETFDGYGRPRGAAASVLVHYKGYYAGSSWACFGIESEDLFQDPAGPMARAMQEAAGFLVRGTFLRNLATGHHFYHPGETVKTAVVVDNQGLLARQATIRFRLEPVDSTGKAITLEESTPVEAGASRKIDVEFPGFDPTPDLYRVTARLDIDGVAVDEMETAFVVNHPDVLRSGPTLRFQDNYFTFNGRPMFLFGSDTYSYTYKSAHENPLTWARDHLAARDVGLNLYENLQYTTPDHQMSEADWRSFQAMSQLTQKHHLIFMPGMLIGHNVAIGDELVEEQSRLCGAYAERLKDTPGLLYYINGDYQMQLDKHPEDIRKLWNDWLKNQYGSTDRLRSAWGKAAVKGELGGLGFWPPNSGRWDDVAVVDRLRFQTWLTRRWNESHVAAIRRVDPAHPITSEYYQFPWGGMDLVMTIDGQDVSNIGFFDKPVKDLDVLPLKIRFNDLRARGKGVSLGEYGVKTHPAWSIENGAEFYHIRRTETEQIQLFLAVAHHALGMGLSKIQNWCLRDSQAFVFPWGMFYPNQMVPKDVAYVHRNQSVIWRYITPQYIAPELTVCIPNNMRLGNYEAIGRNVMDHAFETLLGLHYDFNVIDDHHLDQLPPKTRVMVYPAPLAVRDDAYQQLLSWVRSGGTLLVTGDMSRDADRQRTRTQRLAEMIGAEFVQENYQHIYRPATSKVSADFTIGSIPRLKVSPCMKVKARGAEILGRCSDGVPVLLRNACGRGHVYCFTDPTELAGHDDASVARGYVYDAVLREAGVKALAVEPNMTWIHAMAQPTRLGVAHVVFNRKPGAGCDRIAISTSAGPLGLMTRHRYPAMAVVTREGQVVAASADGRVDIDGKPVITGSGLKAVLSLDGLDIRESTACLVAPFEPGTFEWNNKNKRLVAVVGEFRQGRWTEFETMALGDATTLHIDEDRATCLILVCAPDKRNKWASHLTTGLLTPEHIEGY